MPSRPASGQVGTVLTFALSRAYFRSSVRASGASCITTWMPWSRAWAVVYFSLRPIVSPLAAMCLMPY